MNDYAIINSKLTDLGIVYRVWTVISRIDSQLHTINSYVGSVHIESLHSASQDDDDIDLPDLSVYWTGFPAYRKINVWYSISQYLKALVQKKKRNPEKANNFGEGERI